MHYPASFDVVKVKKDSLIQLDFGNDEPVKLNVEVRESDFYENDRFSLEVFMKQIYSDNDEDVHEKEMWNKAHILMQEKNKIEEELYKIKSHFGYEGKLSEKEKYVFQLPSNLGYSTIYKCVVDVEWDSDEHKSRATFTFKFELLWDKKYPTTLEEIDPDEIEEMIERIKRNTEEKK